MELILTRPREQKLIASAKGLKFLVLDELHTYRGRQGADVALLLRRLRELLAAEAMQCVGTSATLAGRGSWDEQRSDVARLATRLVGDEVVGSDIIGETLERTTNPNDETNPAHVKAHLGESGSASPRISKHFPKTVTSPSSSADLFRPAEYPLVEGIATFVLNSALDPLLGGLARRAGVVRSKAVQLAPC